MEALTSNEITINIQIDRLLKTLADPESFAMGMGSGGQLLKVFSFHPFWCKIHFFQDTCNKQDNK